MGATGYAVATLVADIETANATITGGSVTGITDLLVADGGTGDVSPLRKTKVATRKKLNFEAENAPSTLDVWAKKFQTINRSSFQIA